MSAQGATGATLTVSAIPRWSGVQVYLHRLLVGLLAGPYASPQSEDIKHIQIAARFHFYALPENPAVQSGEFELSGTFDPDLGLLDLYPSKWIDRPDGYNLVGLRGMLEEDRQGLKGAIDAAGCGAIVLRRAADAAQDQPVQPSPGPSTPVQVEVSEELVKLNQEVYQRFKAGEYGQALPIAEQALGIAERLYGPNHPTVAVELRFVVQVLQAAGRSAEAEPLMRRALAIDEKNLSPDDPSIAFDLKILTGLLVDVSWKNDLPQTDRDRIVLTGQLPDVLERAVPLALIASLLLLWIYRRAVMLSMRSRADSADGPAAGMDLKPASVAPALPLQIVTTEEDSARGPAASKVESRALAGPWLNAAVYSVAGLGYVVALTSAFLYAGGFAFLPMRFAVNALALAWPVVLTIGLVAASSWRGWLTAALIYFLLFAAVSAVGMARSETLTWDQPIRLWLLTNLPGTFLILAFLPRQIRAVGPMVLVFMIAAVGGSTLWHNVFEVSPRLMLPVVDFFGSLGFSDMQAVSAATYAFQLFGALMLALIGWMFLRGVGNLYRLRWISDQSVIVDSLWFLFALTSAIDFAFFGLLWFLAPLAAFAIYKIMSVLGFAILRQRPGGTASDPTLLLLRVFSLGKRSALLFNAFGKLWCHGGSMRLIAGPDLATSTVEPHEFLDFLSGKLARRFISGPQALTQRLAETEPRRDFDGRYRVADFFCHDDTWRMVLGRLARESDAVLMDLRNFSPNNQGCIFEIKELLGVVPLDRVVFVVDETTDLGFLREVLTQCWAALAADSPNRKLADPRVLLFRFAGNGSVPSLVRAMGGASTHVQRPADK
ncbi:MAG TPA: hypothetical protein DCL72_10075 [Rhizobiales bacterium]|jgi:hypothetical protein|nr:hypothetical protein [Hyphomicrobiales bacterium]